MKLIFKQKFFSWFDSYNIYDENDQIIYKVKGKLAWTHKLKIYDSSDKEVGTIKEKMFTLLPEFEIYENDNFIGSIKKELTFFKPRFNLDFNGWYVKGNFFLDNYEICDKNNNVIALVEKDILRFTDTYIIDVSLKENALYALMIVIAIDIEKCSKKD